MPLPPVGHTLLTHTIRMEGGVYIAELARRMHELPPPEVQIDVAGPDAEQVARLLVSRGRLARAVAIPDLHQPAPERPEYRLWRADHVVESKPLHNPVQVLDFGCGSGRDAVAMASRGMFVTAFDILPDAIARGRDLEARYGDGPPIEWTTERPSGRFDLVLLLRCGRRELVEQALEHVSPGGMLWTTVRSDLVDDLLKRSAHLIEHDHDWTRLEFLR